jgi:hypothetical protein
MSGLRFSKRITIIPGILSINLNKKSVSATVGAGPVHRTISSTGRRTTSVNLPGPFSWRRSDRRR